VVLQKKSSYGALGHPKFIKKVGLFVAAAFFIPYINQQWFYSHILHIFS